MVLLAGLALGAAGSLHCLSMCGPLVAALHGGASSRWWMPVLLHHAGRALTYGSLGLIAGLAGREVTAGGFGRSLSVVAGVLLLAFAAGAVVPMADGVTRRLGLQVARGLSAVRRGSRPPGGWRAMAAGALNALLPCGLVYGALAAAVAVGTPGSSALFMLGFGIGTSPMLLGVSRVTTYARALGWQRLRLARPIGLALLGLLLVWRGVAGPASIASHGDRAHHQHELAVPRALHETLLSPR
jgi:sulfite exporter TauE/SafE